jgi:hypothetical protein
MGMADRTEKKGTRGSGGKHGAADQGVQKRSVTGKRTPNPAAGKVSRGTGGGPGGKH